MQTFFNDLIPRIQRYSQQLDNLTLLTDQHWVVIDELSNAKNVYIFRRDNSLLISQNGKVEKARWEFVGQNALLIERTNENFLFRHGFFDETVLALKVDGKDEFAFLVNENKAGGELNNIDKVIDFLRIKYLGQDPTGVLPTENPRQYSESKIGSPDFGWSGNSIIVIFSIIFFILTVVAFCSQ